MKFKIWLQVLVQDSWIHWYQVVDYREQSVIIAPYTPSKHSSTGKHFEHFEKRPIRAPLNSVSRANSLTCTNFVTIRFKNKSPSLIELIVYTPERSALAAPGDLSAFFV